jgi:hypothetical protein
MTNRSENWLKDVPSVQPLFALEEGVSMSEDRAA